jgi:hypothetical protein
MLVERLYSVIVYLLGVLDSVEHMSERPPLRERRNGLTKKTAGTPARAMMRLVTVKYVSGSHSRWRTRNPTTCKSSYASPHRL